MRSVLSLDLQSRFEESARIQEFWNQSYEPFLAIYPDQFVAVRISDWKVVATNVELVGILDDLASRHISNDDVTMKFVSESSRSLIL
jgi:hypothetical protein